MALGVRRVAALNDLAQHDWSATWWQPWRAVAGDLAQRIASGQSSHQALNAMADARPGAAVRPQFVASSAMPLGAHYEDYIFSSKQCPIRADIHDFFNGLVWLQFPRTKTRINQLQAGEIAANGVRSTRGPLRDALTLFDESAAI